MNGNPAVIGPHRLHRYTLRVYYEDTDAGGIVYHANYLRYAERARTEALRDLGIPHATLVERHGLMLVVRRVKVDYLRPARLDDSLVVLTEPLAVGAASVMLRQTVIGADEGAGRHAVLEIGLASIRLDDQRPGRLPAPWRETLKAMLAAGDG
jgi:acyl-CoA thioester hydrolase